MSRFLLPLAAAALLAGCGLTGAPAYGPVPGAPMHARIYGTTFGRVQFTIDRPAYVAVFEMIPGSGMRVVHPGAGVGDQFVTAGVHSLLDRRWRSNDLGFFPTSFAGSGAYGGSQWAGPRYFFLIASQAPLRVTPYVHSPMALRNALGLQSFASRNPYQAMDALADLVLTDATPGSWTSDVYVDWPEPAMPPLLNTSPPMRVVQCADGSRIVVPLGASSWRCPNGSVEGPKPPTDSSAVRKPSRRRPEPPRNDRPAATPDRARPDGAVARPGAPEQRPQRERPRPERPQVDRTRPTRPPAESGRVRATEPRPTTPRSSEPRPVNERPERPMIEPRPAAPPAASPAAERAAPARPASVRPDTR